MKCPLGYEGRHCEYQESFAKDIISAISGDLLFLCKKYSKIKDCPKLKAMKELLK